MIIDSLENSSSLKTCIFNSSHSGKLAPAPFGDTACESILSAIKNSFVLIQPVNMLFYATCLGNFLDNSSIMHMLELIGSENVINNNNSNPFP